MDRLERGSMKKIVEIGNYPVGFGQPPFFVAEIGINHNGDVMLAKKAVGAAIGAGCQAVKFQKRTVPVVYSEQDLAKKRQIPPDNGIMENAINRGVLPQEAIDRLTASHMEDTTNGDLKWALELTAEEYGEIDRFCKSNDILWFASPWDEESVDFLEKFNPPCYKVASPCLTDKDLLIHMKETRKPIILATGMSTYEEISQAVSVLGEDNLIILHAVSEYPPVDKDLNLSAINTLMKKFPSIPVGYSGHEKDILPSVIAVSMGACMVERHLTLDRRTWGTDHAASLEPDEFYQLIKQANRVAEMLGDGVKKISPKEREIMIKLRRKYGFAGV